MSFDGLWKGISSRALEEEIDRRIKAVGKVVGDAAAHRLLEEARRKIPSGGGWYAVYRDAFDVQQIKEDQWLVNGLAKIGIDTVPADRTLLTFSGDTTISGTLAPYNPWPIDLIPPVVGGYTDTVVLKPSNIADTDSRRDYLAPVLDVIRQALKDAGAVLGGDADFVSINGNVYADVAAMAVRLEHGFHDFPHIPHWSIALAKAKTSLNRWLTQGDTPRRVHKALSGDAT